MDPPFARRILAPATAAPRTLAPALFAEDFDLPPLRRTGSPPPSAALPSRGSPEPLHGLEPRLGLDPMHGLNPARSPDTTEPPDAAEPPDPPPSFTADDLTAARSDGFAKGEAAGRRAAMADAEADAQAALAAIALHLGEAAEAAQAVADAAAEAVTRMVLAGLGAAFPRFSARFGPAEVEALVQRLLPALQNEPRAAIHVSAAALDGVQAALAALDTDRRERIRLAPDERLAAGDVRITWEAGEATRDGARLWQEIEAILAPAGLMPAAPHVAPASTTAAPASEPAPAAAASPAPASTPEASRRDPFGMPHVKEPAHGQ